MSETTTTAIAIRPETGGTLATAASTPGFIDSINKMGEWFARSGMFGTSRPEQGQVLALACAITGKDPFTIMSENMIVENRLTRRYEVMLADLRRAGGDYDWIDDGSDGEKATISITWKGKTRQYTYTMAMAKRAELVRPGGGWTKRPDNMLRSKAVRNGLQMYAPEVGNLMTPEDAEEIAAEERSSGKPAQTAEDIKRRQQQIAAMDAETSTVGQTVVASAAPAKPTPPAEVIIEATIEPTAETPPTPAVADEPPFDATPAQPAKATLEQQKHLAELAKTMGMTADVLIGKLKDKFRVDHPRDLTQADAAKVIANFQKAIEAKKQQAS